MKNRCPVCRKWIKAPRKNEPDEAKFFPFCSRRCKLIDLGTWLDAEYKIISDLKSQNPTDQADTSQEVSADSK